LPIFEDSLTVSSSRFMLEAWRLNRLAVPNYRQTYTNLHNVMSQKWGELSKWCVTKNGQNLIILICVTSLPCKGIAYDPGG
jgi:hypothetical protein